MRRYSTYITSGASSSGASDRESRDYGTPGASSFSASAALIPDLPMTSSLGRGLQLPWWTAEFEAEPGRQPFICARAHIQEYREGFKRKLGRGEVNLAEHEVGHHFIASLLLRLRYYVLQQRTVASSYPSLTTSVIAA